MEGSTLQNTLQLAFTGSCLHLSRSLLPLINSENAAKRNSHALPPATVQPENIDYTRVEKEDEQGSCGLASHFVVFSLLEPSLLHMGRMTIESHSKSAR